tara:strand:+ start:1760 stop:2008 length:249 start_codon:yes stop_codon:yes gene_type:complete
MRDRSILVEDASGCLGDSLVVIEGTDRAITYVDLSQVICIRVASTGALTAHVPGGSFQLLDLERASADSIVDQWLSLRAKNP